MSCFKILGLYAPEDGINELSDEFYEEVQCILDKINLLLLLLPAIYVCLVPLPSNSCILTPLRPPLLHQPI
jgi:hypothetical protein